jgi:peptidoglycan/LPS O-acetylase OafA/YrhL
MTFRWLEAGSLPRDNNFDLIRLFAATQVVLVHATSHLHAELAYPWAGIVSLFSGVPIFFFISGILVSSSLASRSMRSYAEARARRVMPALWLAFVIAFILLCFFGQITASNLGSVSLWAWAGTQITVFQIYNPAMFRDFGVGVVNGSLWTIPVEIGFYCILPVLIWLASLLSAKRRTAACLLSVSAVISFAVGQAAQVGADTSLWWKVLYFSPASHFWQFALGSLTYMYFGRVSEWTNRLCRLPSGWRGQLSLYLLFGVFVTPLLPKPLADITSTLFLYVIILTAAINVRSFASLLRGNDISYGVYLFHMLVVNALVELKLFGIPAILLTFAVTYGLAWLSWNLLERKVLRRGSLRKHQPERAGVMSAA